jgi:glycosidase
MFDFPLSFAIKDVLLKDQPIQKIIDVLQRDSLYTHPEDLVTFIGNHDTRRFMSEAGADSVRLNAAFSLLITMRGIPQLYSGDEIAMPGGDDPDNRRDFPGGFPGDVANAFSPAGRTPQQAHTFDHLQSLLKLRAAHSALRRGEHFHVGWDETYYAFVRQDRNEKVFIVFNNAKETRDLLIPVSDTVIEQAQKLIPLINSPDARFDGGQIQVSIPPKSVAIYQVE